MLYRLYIYQELYASWVLLRWFLSASRTMGPKTNKSKMWLSYSRYSYLSQCAPSTTITPPCHPTYKHKIHAGRPVAIQGDGAVLRGGHNSCTKKHSNHDECAEKKQEELKRVRGGKCFHLLQLLVESSARRHTSLNPRRCKSYI